jgi:hypothetical protein
MKFHCQNCGEEIRVPSVYAGKKGRCPQCKTVITVPGNRVESGGSEAATTGQTQEVPKSPLAGLTFLDVPEEAKAESESVEQADSTEEAYEQFRKLQGGLARYASREIEDRKLPWIIDIFLYPLNKEGLSIILLCAGLPLVLRALIRFLMIFTTIFPPMLVFWILFFIIHWIAVVVLMLYVCWYWYECVLDSSAGAIRAPETAGITPGLADILRQTFRTIACLAYSMLPALAFLGYTQQHNNPVFWLLCGLGAFLFPMIILAVAVFDSLLVANPFLVLGSILSTFVRYCGVVVFCPGPFLLMPLAGVFLFSYDYWFLGYLFLLLSFYLGLILAHVLGRVFWNCRDQLNWEV